MGEQVTEPVTRQADPAPRSAERSPKSLTIVLVRAAERLRTDPAANFEHCAVRGALDVLRTRLADRMSSDTRAAGGIALQGTPVDA